MSSPAPACKAALAQATKRWPKRDKSSDGIMGDAAHQARVSDHNQGNAFDLTHDPKHGPDCAKIAPLMPKDPRVKYVIFDRRIWSREKPYWHDYTGSNPHTAHMHVSIKSDHRGDTSPWPGIAEVKLSPSLTPGDPAYHTRAKMRRDSQLWNTTIGTKREPSPKADGIVHITGPSIIVRGLKYTPIEWGGNSGWVRYDDIEYV